MELKQMYNPDLNFPVAKSDGYFKRRADGANTPGKRIPSRGTDH